jgi:putative transposase
LSIRRPHDAGFRYFFTVVTHERRPILVAEIERLRSAFRRTIERHPFRLEAIVILPDHLHTMWMLPEADADFSRRWMVLKRMFSTGLADPASVSPSLAKKREKGIWQRRFWDHAIRDEEDRQLHLDYIHYNPVKHGYCSAPLEWPYSSFRRFVKRGQYEAEWGRKAPADPGQIAAERGIEAGC